MNRKMGRSAYGDRDTLMENSSATTKPERRSRD
jgi:hypothetical protein